MGRPAAWAAALAAVCALGCLAGCTARVYRAADLPVEFIAPRAENLQTVDLSRLAAYAVSNERIDRGDVLEVTIITDYANLTTTTAPVRVMEDGTGKVPVIGRLALAGLELDEAEQLIAAEARHRNVYPNAHVIVTMKRQRVNRVTVMGAVEEPGTYELARGQSNLLAALNAAGGLTEEAASDVVVRRPAQHDAGPGLNTPPGPRVAGGPEAELTAFQQPLGGGAKTVRVNLVRAASEGRGGYYLDDGDVVMVPEQPPKRIFVTGLVNKPDEYEFPVDEDVYLLGALAKAGGRRMEVADNVLIIRHVPGREEPVRIRTSVMEADRHAAANVRLAAGDVVKVQETPVTFVLGALKDFVRFGLSSTVPLF
jgi:polysaccharide export outer membrane protein